MTLTFAARRSSWMSYSGRCGERGVLQQSLPATEPRETVRGGRAPTAHAACRAGWGTNNGLGDDIHASLHGTRCAHAACSNTPLLPSRQIQIANIFLVGCPACSHNFKQLFCLLSCHPDQSTFSEVTATQLAADTNATAVANVSYYVTPAFGDALYDSCKDVVYPVMNQRAMKFVGG